MDFPGHDHVYKCIPDVLGNKGSETPFALYLKGITQDEFDAAVHTDAVARLNFSIDVAMQMSHDNNKKVIGEHVDRIEGLTVGGKPLTSFDELCASGPREIVAWITRAVYSTQFLVENEVKN